MIHIRFLWLVTDAQYDYVKTIYREGEIAVGDV